MKLFHSLRPHATALFATFILTAFLCAGNADVPVGYKGKPFGGTAWALPGRIDFEDYDLGGVNVTWKTDDKALQGVAPGSTAANRATDGESDHPAFWITNTNPGEVDMLPDGSLYPAEGDHKSIYIGAAHASDYADVTVNVAKAGTYWLSSHFASQPNEIKFHISFNGTNKTGTVTLPGTNSYHAWKYYRNFAHVDLEAGVQVMQFYLDSYHLNWDYLNLASDSSAVTGLRDGGTRPGRTRAGNARTYGRIREATIVPMENRKNLLRVSSPWEGGTRLSILDLRGRVLSTSLPTLDPSELSKN